MKAISRILLYLFSLLSLSLSQEIPPVGFLRVVNAVSPGLGKADIVLDGRSLFADGYDIGQTTGGYGVKSGTRSVEVRKDGLVSGTTRVDIAKGETLTLIAFAEKDPKVEGDEKPKWRIKLLRLKQQNVEKGFGLSVVSVLRNSETNVELFVEGRNKTEQVTAKRLSITKVDLGRMRGEVLVKVGGQVLTTVSPDSPGNYVVILYENADEKIEALNYFDPKFVIAG